MTTTAANEKIFTSEASTPCPTWCREHVRWDDGTFVAHEAEIPTGIKQDLHLDLCWNPEPTSIEPSEPYIHLDATDAVLLPAQARALAQALNKAADLIEDPEVSA